MSPRRSIVEAQRTRGRIVSRATEIASVDGLDGLTIGKLAAELTMSKSGVLGHFGSKQSLQLAAIHDVIGQFGARVIDQALRAEPGIARLRELVANWITYLAATGLPGGCLLTAAGCEFDGQPGEVRDVVAESWSQWRSLLRAEFEHAVERGELPGDLDVEQAVFELVALGPALNQALQLHGDGKAVHRARQAARKILLDAG
jgi:AcrR family transcriptional regulator